MKLHYLTKDRTHASSSTFKILHIVTFFQILSKYFVHFNFNRTKNVINPSKYS